MRSTTHKSWAPLIGLVLFGSAVPAAAHVKWFSKSSGLRDLPLSLAEIITPTFCALTALSVVVVIGLTLLDEPLQEVGVYRRLRGFLEQREAHAGPVMRIATGMSLLLSWQADVLLAPELGHDLAVVSWLQFIAILCLVDRRTSPVSGAVLWLLYAIGIHRFGLLHMLDYAAFIGVGYYLFFHDHPHERARAWVKPILFGTTGLSLAWLALEKLVFPTWSLVLLEQNPVLSLGLPPRFFLTAAAFVEFSLGFLLIVGVLGRPLALVITLVFFLTTMVFGKDEVVGHLILHGVLIVFMLEGTTGRLAPPFRLHSSRPMRSAFVGVNFTLLLGGLLLGYHQLASPRYLEPLQPMAAATTAASGTAAPTVALGAEPAPGGGWVLSLTLEHFRITSMGKPGVQDPSAAVEGHAHLLINGELRGMIFSDRHELGSLPPGQHIVTVELSTPDHQTLLVDGAPVRSSVTIEQGHGAGDG